MDHVVESSERWLSLHPYLADAGALRATSREIHTVVTSTDVVKIRREHSQHGGIAGAGTKASTAYAFFDPVRDKSDDVGRI